MRLAHLTVAWIAVGVLLLIGPGPRAATAHAAARTSTAKILTTPPAPARGLSDGRVLGNDDPAVRAGGIDVARAAGARFARLPLTWSQLVDGSDGFARPDESTTPLSDPSNAAYRWARLDASLRDLAAADLTPIAYFMAAPAWATSAPRHAYSSPGTWAPRPADLAAFASAAARRYDGTWPDPLRPGQALPRIAHFQTWNEPNLARYLQPQWVPGPGGRPRLFSARWYRGMHAAASAAIRARQPDATIALAGLAPTGDRDDGSARVSPMRFLRALLCLDDAKQRCGPPLPMDAIALHPLSTGDPDRPAVAADDLAVADLRPKLDAVLERARATGRLRPGPEPALWITELNWTSADGGGVVTAQQPAVVGRAMMRLAQARAVIVNWQFATDPSPGRTGGLVRPAGLTVPAPADPRQLPGAPKAFLAGFRFPAAAIAVGTDRAYVWAQAPSTSSPRQAPPASSPAATANQTARVERRVDGHWRRIAGLPVSTGGVAHGFLPVPTGELVRVRIGAATSPTVRVQLRLGRIRSSTSASSTARRAQSSAGRQAPDPRPLDPLGPGAFLPIRPIVDGGTPFTLASGPVLPVPAPERPRRRLLFAGTTGADVLIGTSGADRLSGLAGDDLVIGLGGDDRLEAGTGRDLVARNRTASRR